MKASVVKITEGAKLRDTVNRNIILTVRSHDVGKSLYDYQVKVSQIAGTKQHTVILLDENGTAYVLFFNIGKINEMDMNEYLKDNTKEVSTITKEDE